MAHSVSTCVCFLGILSARCTARKHWTHARCFDHCCCDWSSACVTNRPWKP
uniref:Secreted protein n=1 Tax=Arundo donax TaxID=35708 RepID=A0A0A8XT34_ARUDO